MSRQAAWRRLKLALAGLAGAGLVFGLFCWLSPSVPILSNSTQPPSVPAVPERSGGGGSIAGTEVELVENSRWVRRDPQTKRVIEIGGFGKLLTPPAGSVYWLVESPYLIRYEDRFVCRVDARRGRFQMDADGQVPSSVELSEEVILQIGRPEAKEEDKTTRIYLENLTYISERSEFFTEGPVRVESPDAQLKGKGLTLIYNPQLSRMEYLEVRDLEYLLVKNAAGLGAERMAKDSLGEGGSGVETVQSDSSSPQKEVLPTSEEPESKEPLYYQCTLRDNVMIQYGRRLVVAGADQVLIRQILWRDNSKEQPSDSSEPSESSDAAAAEPPSFPKRESFLKQAEKPEAGISQPGDNEVLITCKGGVVVQAAPEADAEDALVPAVEMKGRLQIERVAEDSKTRLPLAVCSALRYAPTEDVLELYADSAANPIWLYLDPAGSRIRTAGNVFWDRRTNLARVDGPGKVFLQRDLPQNGDERTEVLFAGPMDLEFARLPSDSQLSLKTVNLSGGVEAVLEKEGIHSRAREALFAFQPLTNRLQRLDMNGDVKFETASDGQAAQVEAEKTRFYFDSAGEVKTANLAGGVRMVSAEQTVEADAADIQFEKSKEGRLVPAQVHLEGKSQIQSAADGHLPPARFEALRIDYDFLNGKAVAVGPVFFSFYTTPDLSSRLVSEPIPVEVTAEEAAEFLTDGRGTIEQVVFRGNVTAQWKAQTEREQLIRRFFGERLVVDLDSDSGSGQRIRRVSMQDRQVFFESLHFVDRKKADHLRLTCRQFDYWGDENKLVAEGPGRMELNNQQTPPAAESQAEPFSFRKPCFAYMEGFDRLIWHLSKNEIVGEGTEGIYLNYWPIEKGQLADQLIVQCVRVWAGFGGGDGGRSELKFLRADGGVEYREQKQGGRYLQGDTLTYDKEGGWVVIEGSPERPCKADGVNVQMIQYHPQTGQMKTKLSPSPSSLPLQGG